MPESNTAVTTFRLEVRARTPHSSNKLVKTAHQLGLTALEACIPNRLYFIEGQISFEDAERIGREILTDPVTERLVISDRLSVIGEP